MSLPRLIIQHSIDVAASANIDAILSSVESRLLLENSNIIKHYRMTDENCAFSIKRTADSPNTKFILEAWPYILTVEIRREHRTMSISIYNEFEGVSNYELCQYLIQICREIVAGVGLPAR